MFCTNCGKKLDSNSNFCTNCGMMINNNDIVQSNNMQFNNISSNNVKKNNKRKIVIIILIVLLLLLIVAGVVVAKGNNKSRTVMIYLDGSNLEADYSIVTAELESINPSLIDLDKTNILLYTGGTEKWHNFISNEENAIYILRKNGFEKLESYDRKNMGDPNTLTEFLKYGYDNYKTSQYNLIFYDHGGAIHGAIYDDFSNDNLSLRDMDTALNNSPFNENNKLQSVVFRTCLNGTVEIASLFSKYADYLVASEEITRGSKYSNVLSFLNKTNANDNGIEFGKKFINRYYEQMSELDPYGDIRNTYSIIDLSKIDKVTNELNTYFASLDVNKYYNSLSYNRSNMYQYGSDEKAYDMVDLYELVRITNDYTSVDNKKLLKAMDDAIIYNNSNMNDSYGLSIYFPYNSDVFLDIYSRFSKFDEYNKFINKFVAIKSGNTSPLLSFSKDQVVVDDNNKISFQLTKEQKSNFGHANYYVFRRDPDHPNYFFYIYLSNNYDIDDNGLITTSIDNKLVMMKGSDSYQYIPVTNVKNGNSESLVINGIIYDEDLEFSDPLYMASVKLNILEKNNKMFFSDATIISKNGRLHGTMVDLNNYEIVSIFRSRRRLLDGDGNFIDNIDDWESSPEIIGIEAKLDGDDVVLKKASLEPGSEYYVVFEIFDINNNSTLSDLIRIGD